MSTEALSTRQIEVVRLLAAGKSQAEIARALNISAKTVEAHLNALRDKLRVNGQNQLVAAARRDGYITETAT